MAENVTFKRLAAGAGRQNPPANKNWIQNSAVEKVRTDKLYGGGMNQETGGGHPPNDETRKDCESFGLLKTNSVVDTNHRDKPNG